MDQAACGIVNPQLPPGLAVAARNPDRRVASARIGIDLKRGNACDGRSPFSDRPGRIIDNRNAAGVMIGDEEAAMKRANSKKNLDKWRLWYSMI
jgi:hypothetical protein